MEGKLLLDEDFARILQKKFKNQDTKYLNSEWKPLSENVEGFLGEHYIVKVNYKVGKTEQTESFFVKTKPTKNEYQREYTDESSFYTKEIFMYSNLFKKYEELDYRTNFAAKLYYCKNNETIVLEDLKE